MEASHKQSLKPEGGGVGVVLKGPGHLLIECAIQFAFLVSNNMAKYETLVNGINLTLETGVSNLLVHSDSQLVVN